VDTRVAPLHPEEFVAKVNAAERTHFRQFCRSIKFTEFIIFDSFILKIMFVILFVKFYIGHSVVFRQLRIVCICQRIIKIVSLEIF